MFFEKGKTKGKGKGRGLLNGETKRIFLQSNDFPTSIPTKASD
jgi:hypothetical protein